MQYDAIIIEPVLSEKSNILRESSHTFLGSMLAPLNR